MDPDRKRTRPRMVVDHHRRRGAHARLWSAAGCVELGQRAEFIVNEVELAKLRLRETAEQAEQSVRTSVKGAAMIGTVGAAVFGLLAGTGSLRFLGRKRSSLADVLNQVTAATALARQFAPLIMEIFAARRDRSDEATDPNPQTCSEE